MNIRKATAKDIGGIYSVFLDMVKAEDNSSRKVAKHFMQVRKRKENFERHAKKELLKEIREKGCLYLIAQDNEKVVGYIRGSIKKQKDPFFNLPTIGYLHALCVKKAYRGKGIASKLNIELEKWFKKYKCSHIYLEVFSENAASKLYEKWGYSTINYVMAKKVR